MVSVKNKNVGKINCIFVVGLHGKLTGAGGGGFAFTFLPQDVSEDVVSQAEMVMNSI